MKHYLDIEHIKENTEFVRTNTEGFEVGDIIHISEKIDGSNSSFRYNMETGHLDAFSHKQELSPLNTLRGFYTWVQDLDSEDYKYYSNFIFFGEWLVPHTVQYNRIAYDKFYLFDIYDTCTGCWMPQTLVEGFADMMWLNYVPKLYSGPFISWEHCKSYMNRPSLGFMQEGIVIKNQTKLNDPNNRLPTVLKIVNASFKETKAHKGPKVDDPEKVAARSKAEELMRTIVTEARVRKMIHKLVDEGLAPEEMTAKDMGIVAKYLPKRIFEDCLKEERDTVMEAGEYAGKCGQAITMELARKIILGN